MSITSLCGNLLLGRRLEHVAQPTGDQVFGLTDHSRHQFRDGRDVVDQAHRGADRPDAGIDVTELEDLAATHAGDEVFDVLEWTAAFQDLHHLARHRITGDPRGVVQCPEDQFGAALVAGDDRVLDVLVDRGLGGAHEPRSHVDAVGAQRQRGHQTPGGGEATGGDHRDLDLVGCRRYQHQARDVVLAWMTGALEPVDADAVHAQALRLDRMPHRGALVQHLDPVVVEHRQMWRRIGSGGLHDLDAGVDDDLAVLVVGRRIDGRQDREVHPERLVGQIAATGNLAGQIGGCGLGQRGDESQGAGVGHRRHQLGPADPLHAALHDRVVDPERLGELRRQHRRPYRGAMRMAPSRRMTSPLSIGFATMWAASAPYSSGLPSRAGCGTCAPSDFLASSGRPASSGVSNRPGAMVTTRMPLLAKSRAIGSVMPTTPPFDAEYAAWPICPSNAATEAVVMIPPPPSPPGSVLAMRSAPSRSTLKVPIRLMFTTRAKFSSGQTPWRLSTRIASPVPAQLTTMRSGPSESATSRAAVTASGSVTSAAANRARSPSWVATSSPFD